ncbi:MAG: hypothetical protein EU536_00890 [Promethearchaeota archaeon]|nr:MAG: hypothetical protein EU536_00890 [Candidatus Lokiarchaeota archaeon]
MRAAVFEDIYRIVYVEDYPRPTPGPDDALVKVYYCGICGSDITNFRSKLYKTPLIMGHEFAGEVVELGENIRGFQIGDRVVGINVRLDVFKDELKGLGVFNDGGFAEYVKVPKEFLFHAPKKTPFEECVIVESCAVAIRAMRLAKLESNQRIVIIGGGNVGLATLSVLQSELNPSYIIVIEPHEYLREMALELGATAVFAPIKNKIRKYFNEKGAPNYIIECVGNERAFKLALDLVSREGKIVLEGMYRGNVTFPLMLMNSKEICIQGVLSHSRDNILQAIQLFETKKIQASKFISEIVPLQNIQKAFERYLEPGDRKFIKLVVKI